MQKRDAWNHNLHYHPLIRRALPLHCRRILDIGCGEGVLARELASAADAVIGLDADAATIQRARQETAATNVSYVCGDFVTRPFRPRSFDAVVAVATLHHVDMATGLDRMAELLHPGGTLVVIGLARSLRPKDMAFDAVGALVHQGYKRTRTYRETSAPRVWPPPVTYGQAQRVAERRLPGAQFRRRVLWRYSLVWKAPVPTA